MEDIGNIGDQGDECNSSFASVILIQSWGFVPLFRDAKKTPKVTNTLEWKCLGCYWKSGQLEYNEDLHWEINKKKIYIYIHMVRIIWKIYALEHKQSW